MNPFIIPHNWFSLRIDSWKVVSWFLWLRFHRRSLCLESCWSADWGTSSVCHGFNAAPTDIIRCAKAWNLRTTLINHPPFVHFWPKGEKLFFFCIEWPNWFNGIFHSFQLVYLGPLFSISVLYGDYYFAPTNEEDLLNLLLRPWNRFASNQHYLFKWLASSRIIWSFCPNCRRRGIAFISTLRPFKESEW